MLFVGSPKETGNASTTKLSIFFFNDIGIDSTAVKVLLSGVGWNKI